MDPVASSELLENNGSPEWTRTIDLFRVNFEVIDLNPFPHRGFPHSEGLRTLSKIASFDGEFDGKFPPIARVIPHHDE
jgi:hypothetical protein